MESGYENWQEIIEAASAFLAARTPAAALSALNNASPEYLENPLWWSLTAQACMQLGQPDRAAESYRKALSLDPSHIESLVSLGELLHYTTSQADSRVLFEKALATDPACAPALILSVEAAMLMADQHDRGRLIERLRFFIRLDAELLYLIKAAYWMPFLEAGPELEQQAWSAIREKFALPVPDYSLAASGQSHDNRKIRIGYISPRFGDHPIGHVTKSLYGTHDRDRFEVFLYSTSLRNHDLSEYNTFIRGSCDRYTELDGLDVETATTRIREDGVDILVDLNGYMGQTYILEVFSRRAAPVQVYWLGHAGALGLPFYDYVIGDSTVTPREEDAYYTESIARLPDTFHPYDRHEIAQGKWHRSRPGLAEDAFVFCAFNNPVKIDPTVLRAWVEILRRVPHGQIWLSPGRNPAVEANLKSFVAEHGIAPERLIFSRPLGDKRFHLARHQLADLFLDTFTVTASTTALDALWAGLPIVTRPGRHFCSRNCASFLRAVGLDDMVCSSTDEYIDRAVFLAENPDALAALRDRLARNRDTYPLFNLERFTRNLEAAYQTMLERSRSGLAPSSFDVPGSITE